MTPQDLRFLADLSPTQDHFLKRLLVEACLKKELHHLSEPGCLGSLGPPFVQTSDHKPLEQPLLSYFFSHFVASFPFITNNPENEQKMFWNDTVQPFIDSVNTKRLSNPSERKENTKERKKINARVLRGLLFFFNSMLSSRRELEYLSTDHLKSSDQGKFDKLAPTQVLLKRGLNSVYTPHALHEYAKMDYVRNLSIDIVAVEIVQNKTATESWNILKPFNPIFKQRLHYSYILQITRRKKAGLGVPNYTYASHFIARRYSEFEKLELALKKAFPGLMTSLNRLPRNIKRDKGVRVKEPPKSRDTSEPSSLHDDTLEVSLTRGETFKYYREKHRLALRGYLCNLAAVQEITHCQEFETFISDPNETLPDLSARQMADYCQRLVLEQNRLATQEEFQNRIARVAFDLSKDIRHFKEQILSQPHLLHPLFREIGTSKLVDDLSPLVRTFLEWCKLEVAATLYQLFLSKDNSSEWFYKCRKFHRLFPYKMCYGILKYTNPMSIVTKIVDLLLMDLPSFGRKKPGHVNNLLSMLFVVLLDEDLNSYSKERERHLHDPPLNVPQYDVFKARIEYFVNQLDYILQEEVKEESVQKGTDYLLEILSSPLMKPDLTEEDQHTFETLIQPSYAAYSLLEENKKLEAAAVYVSLKQLWHLDVRTCEKNLLKQLWQEPELTRLIEQFLTFFYQPLMRVMKRCDVHLVFLDFQHFLNDLIAGLTKLDEGGVYFTSSVEMFDRFKRLLDRHEQGLWRFVRDLYLKDDTHLFLKLISWVESFLIALRTKFVASEKVELDFAGMVPLAAVNPQELVAELDAQINAILDKRRLLKEYLEETARAASASGSSTETDVSPQKIIENNWSNINSSVFDVQAQDLGLTEGDFAEFNFTPGETKMSTGDNRTAKVLQEIAKLNAAAQEDLGPELLKLVGPTHARIADVLA